MADEKEKKTQRTRAQTHELREWCGSVLDTFLGRRGLTYTTATERKADANQLAEIVEARAREIANG